MLRRPRQCAPALNDSLTRVTKPARLPARLADKLGIDQFGNSTMIALDRGQSILFGFNRKYHRTRTIEKFGPASAFYVAQKTSAEPAPAA